MFWLFDAQMHRCFQFRCSDVPRSCFCLRASLGDGGVESTVGYHGGGLMGHARGMEGVWKKFILVEGLTRLLRLKA